VNRGAAGGLEQLRFTIDDLRFTIHRLSRYNQERFAAASVNKPQPIF
jgi:hypothetical protein